MFTLLETSLLDILETLKPANSQYKQHYGLKPLYAQHYMVGSQCPYCYEHHLCDMLWDVYYVVLHENNKASIFHMTSHLHTISAYTLCLIYMAHVYIALKWVVYTLHAVAKMN